ncbi:MAG: hypothetical protein ABI614_03975, partial [Planctomycetota bacterium]
MYALISIGKSPHDSALNSPWATMEAIVISDWYDAELLGVSRQQAMEVVRYPDRTFYSQHGREVNSLAGASCAIFSRSYGHQIESQYTVIVFTGVDIDTTQLHVIVAFRAKHTDVQGLPSSDPRAVLRAFLDEFGVDVTIAGLGTSDLFLGGQLNLPKTIASGGEAMQFLGAQVRTDLIDEPFAMAFSFGDIAMESARHVAPVNMLLFYATEHYAKSISETRSPRGLPERSLAPFRRRRAAIRAEYESRIKDIGYTPPTLDADERRKLYEEAQRAGVADAFAIGSDVSSYQEVLDRVSKSIESFIKVRGLKLPQAVFVGEWPFGKLQATVERIATGDGMLVLVNAGLIAFVYQVAKIFTNSLSLFRLDDQSSVGDLMGLPASNWTMENTVDALSESLAAYVGEGYVGAAPRIPLEDATRAMFGLEIATWAENFVVAHEYGHVLAEDFGTSYAVENLSGSEPIGESQRREVQADLTALNLCLATANWSNGGWGLVDANIRVGGACLFFIVGLFIDATILGPHDFTANQAGTHPVPYFRLKTIMDHMMRYYGKSPLLLGQCLQQWIFDLVPSVVRRAREILADESDT